MKGQLEFSGNINFRSIIAGAIIGIGVYHLLGIGIRGFGVLIPPTSVTYTQRFSYLFARTLVVAASLFLASFVSVYSSRSKDMLSGLLHGLVSVSLVHLVATLAFPVITLQDLTVVQANATWPLTFLKNFFTMLVGWIAGIYGCWLAVKIDLGQIVFRFRDKAQKIS